MERVPPLQPLTTMQEVVCNLLGVRFSYVRVAQELGISPDTVKEYVNAAAGKLPGDLPAKLRCLMWARGAPLEVLDGTALIADLHRQAFTRSPSPGGRRKSPATIG